MTIKTAEAVERSVRVVNSAEPAHAVAHKVKQPARVSAPVLPMIRTTAVVAELAAVISTFACSVSVHLAEAVPSSRKLPTLLVQVLTLSLWAICTAVENWTWL